MTSESTYDWVSDQTSVPVNVNVTKMIMLAGRPVSVGGGVHYWVESATEAGTSGAYCCF